MDWPLFEYDEEAGRYVSAHHPFTQPKAEDVDRLATDPASVYAESLRCCLKRLRIRRRLITDPYTRITRKMFETLGFTKRRSTRPIWFLARRIRLRLPATWRDCFRRLDRLAMLLAGEENIREVIAFPKTAKQLTQ